MSRSLASIKLNLRLTATVTNTLTDGTSVSAAQPSLNLNVNLADGIDVSQANRGWQSVSRTISAGDQETIDLASFEGLDIGGGEGRDCLGQLLTLEEVVALVIQNNNAAGVAGHLEIIPADSEGWTPIGSHTVANGGALLAQGTLLKYQPAADGFDVNENSHRITMRAIGGDVTYSIYIMGRHDDEESSSSSSSTSESSISTSSSSVSTSSISTSSTSSQSASSASSQSASSASSTSSSESSSSLSSDH
jgi:hypothetical protein